MKLGGSAQFFFVRPELTELLYLHPSDHTKSVRALRTGPTYALRSQLHPPRLEQLQVAILHHSDDLGALPVISHVFGSGICKLHIWVEGGPLHWPLRYPSLVFARWLDKIERSRTLLWESNSTHRRVRTSALHPGVIYILKKNLDSTWADIEL